MMHPSLKHTFTHLSAIAFLLLIAVFVSRFAHEVDTKNGELFSGTGISAESGLLASSITTISNTKDITPPPAPVITVVQKDDVVMIDWREVTDDMGTVQYELYRNDKLIARQTGSGFADRQELSVGMTYVYYAKSIDSSGNMSLASNVISHAYLQSGQTSTNQASQDVTYVVIPALEGVYCDSGVRKTPVGFMSVPLDGGYFKVIYPTGEIMSIEPGHLPLSNGKYYWEAVARNGFQSQGSISGTFTLSGDCQNVSTINPYTSTSAEDLSDGAVVPVAVGSSGGTMVQTATSNVRALENNDGLVTTLSSTTKVVPTTDGEVKTKIYQDNKSLSNDSTVSGEIELRIVTQSAESVKFYTVGGGDKKVLGDAELDEFLSRPNEEVWSYFWKTSTSPNDIYKIYAVMVDAKGNKFDSVPISLIVDNRPPLSRGTDELPLEPVELIKVDSAKSNILARVIAPDQCTSMEECEIFCAHTPEKTSSCERFVETIIVPESTSSSTFVQLTKERLGARQFIDSDEDGISDFDELNIFMTDPSRADTDVDGVSDGSELLARTNPLGDRLSSGSTTEPELVEFFDPKNVGELRPDLLAINDIVVTATSTDPTGVARVKEISFTGRGLANSFVTLFIFSNPIVVTVKTDASGVWSYTLDKELPDGAHQIYTTMTDASGKILAKSEPLPFVKQASAVTLGDEPLLPIAEKKTGFFTIPSMLALVALIIGVLGVAVSIMGFMLHRGHEVSHQGS